MKFFYSIGIPQRPPDQSSVHGGPDQDPTAGYGVWDLGRNCPGWQVWETGGAGDHDWRQRGASHSHGSGYSSTYTTDGELEEI